MNIPLINTTLLSRWRGWAILAGMRADLPHSIQLRRPNLRVLLGMAALAALITTITLGSLLLTTATSARTVAEKAQELHNRVQAYSSLIAALRSFQVASYDVAHFDTPQADEEQSLARAGYMRALDTALRLPQHTPHQRQVTQQIEIEGTRVTAHLAQIRAIVADIDRIWHTAGSKAAGVESERSAAPVRQLEALLEAEIRGGDAELDAATTHALSISRVVLFTCIVCVLLAAASWAIIQVLLLRRLSPGLKRLEAGTLAFAAGNLDHRVRLGGNDELTQLGTAFDAMAAQLADKQRTLQQVQVGLEHAVLRRTQDLERANQELAASDSRRRAFLADIGHELRTPLTIIRGEAQVALRTIDDPGFSAQEVFERIVKHTRDLGRMVDDLFLIARAEAGGLSMQIVRTDLRALVASIVGDFEVFASNMGASIRAVPGPVVPGAVDPDRLRRALAALIDNALQHSHHGVNVVVEATCAQGRPTITVNDDGPGVDPAIMPQLFQRFRRGHARSEGSGLGLSLVQALVEAQAGTVSLKNRLGGGLCATIEFHRSESEQEDPGGTYESVAG